jgi:hypothetical protein
MRAMKHYIFQLLVALDQLGTAIFGGWADETISSYAYRLHKQDKLAGRVLMPFIDWVARKVFRAQRTPHCINAYWSERARAQLPPDMRLPG